MAMLGYQNAVLDPAVVLSASSVSDGYSPEFLRIGMGNPSVAWQTVSGVVSATLSLTAPTPITWRVACLARTNLTSSATMRVQVGAYDSGTISAGVVAGVGQALHILPADASGPSMVITLTDAANPDRLLNVPLAYAGPVRVTNIAPSSEAGRDVRRADTSMRGGTVIVEPLSAARTWNLVFAALLDNDIAWLDALESAAAGGINILAVPREGSARASAETILGLLKPGGRGFLTATGHRRTWSATISERL
ncbi:hypothetical protein [Sediminicoccus sp. KRV36]|uniref:hypothetical protein n=1 Tax=Sediminicoccus sp. KRV36 TaxID=3133721 RepID=UPI00200BAB46|nr:hypothetical protein [Sediminicoccus rosea]UPY37225.1 hypothetical protein LHU95_00595 [Sediminicoccus rosea]